MQPIYFEILILRRVYIASALNYPLLSRYAGIKIVTGCREKKELARRNTYTIAPEKNTLMTFMLFLFKTTYYNKNHAEGKQFFFHCSFRAPCHSKLTWNIKCDMNGGTLNSFSRSIHCALPWLHSLFRCSCGFARCLWCLPYRNQFQLKVDLRGWSDWSLSVSQFPPKPEFACMPNRMIWRENRSPKWNHFNALLLHDNDHNDDFYDYLLYLKPFLCHFIDFLSSLYVLTR